MSNLNLITLQNSQTINLGASSTATSVAIPNGRFKVMSQVGVHITTGSTPVATTANFYIPAATLTDSIEIPVGQKVGILNATATADAKITIYY